MPTKLNEIICPHCYIIVPDKPVCTHCSMPIRRDSTADRERPPGLRLAARGVTDLLVEDKRLAA